MSNEWPIIDDHDHLDAVWPDEVTADQRAIWLAMTSADRIKALRRLNAVLSYQAAGRRNGLAHAEMAGVGLPRFEKMMKAWGEERAIQSLVPQVKGRRRRSVEVDPQLLLAASDLVRARPSDSQERIAVSLHERFGSPSLSWWRRLVAKTRRDQTREAIGLFGYRLMIDSTAVPLPVLPAGVAEADELDGERQVDWAVVALVWDAATGLVLGSAVDRAPATVRHHVDAALTAVDELRSFDVGPRVDVSPRLVTTVPFDGDAVETLRIVGRLSELGLRGIHSSRSHGSELMTAFAGRIGALDLNPRFAKAGFEGRLSRTEALQRSGRVPMTLDEARIVVDVELASHNGAVRRSLPPVPVVPEGAIEALEMMVATIRGRDSGVEDGLEFP